MLLTETGVTKAREASQGHLELVYGLVFDGPVANHLPEVVAAFDGISERVEAIRSESAVSGTD